MIEPCMKVMYIVVIRYCHKYIAAIRIILPSLYLWLYVCIVKYIGVFLNKDECSFLFNCLMDNKEVDPMTFSEYRYNNQS